MTEPLRGRGTTSDPCLALGLSLVLLMGCDPQTEAAVQAGVSLHSVRSVELVEDPEDPIGDIQDLVLTPDGSIIIADRYQPRVRAFEEDGRLIRTFGQFGDGPFEFRSVNPISLDSRGRVLVLDGSTGRITRLTRQLEPDSVISASPRPQALIRPLGARQVVATAPGSRSTDITVFDQDWTAEWATPSPLPGPPTEYPYIGSLGRTLITTGTNHVVVSFSLIHEIRVFTADGAEAYVVTPPEDWTPVRVPELGEFAGPNGRSALNAWMGDSNVIVRLDVVADSLLVVTRGRLTSDEVSRQSSAHERIDVLDLRTGEYLVQSLDLPSGVEVVEGREGLVLLSSRPPGPWRLEFHELRLEP